MSRKVYPSDVSDEEREFVAPYLTLLCEDAAQRVHPLRDVFDALRWMVKAGCPWRLLPGDFPPWQAVAQQGERWRRAGCFEARTHDLRELLRVLAQRDPRPTAAIFDGRTLQSGPESGERAGYDGYQRKKGSKVHVAVDTLGHLLALLVTPASEQGRAQRSPCWTTACQGGRSLSSIRHGQPALTIQRRASNTSRKGCTRWAASSLNSVK